MLQIRIRAYDGSDPVILERAKNRNYSEAINSGDDGITFSIAKSDDKAYTVDPYAGGYLNLWEVWDTLTNERLNFGPITNIADQGTEWKVTGAGRAALLMDFYKTKKTFYAPIYSIIEEATYENIAAEPRTTTLVPDAVSSAAQTTVFGNTVIIDERYSGLSKNTKDRAIDDDTGDRNDELDKVNTYFAHTSFWSGMSVADSHIVDLGEVYELNKIVYHLPVWGGPERWNNRTYDYEIAIATDEGSTTTIQGREIGAFTTIYQSDVPNMATGGINLVIGLDGSSVDVQSYKISVDPVTTALPPVPVRYLRIKISDTHAWYGTHFDEDASEDLWDRQCDPDVAGSKMAEDINDRDLEPPNDCHASVTEVEANKKIMDIFNVKQLALQRVDNNSLQITYAHTPVAGDTKTTSAGFRKFEPGSFFRKFRVTYSGAGSSVTKFFDSDCSGCYPDGFRFGIVDDQNSLIYATDTTADTNQLVKTGAYTRQVLMKGASNAVVTYCDAWPAKLDPFSWGGSYSYTDVAGDTAIIHFRGESFKWYATVPEGETGAEVDVDIRELTGSGWTGWSNLTTFQLPSGISSEVVYEIPYESNFLESGITYEIRITNNDGEFCSIDSFEGYWESSMVEYNEDSTKVFISRPEKIKQIYDKRFSNGSMYKWDTGAFVAITFTGDRIVLVSAKGRHHGTGRIILLDQDIAQGLYDPGTETHVFIPGGNADGSLTIDLDSGSRGNEITQYIAFDSDDYFTDGLPWGVYTLGFYLLTSEIETYTSNTADIEFDSFVPRCKDCEPSLGEDITVNKPIFFDGVFVHEKVGLSVSFENEPHLEIVKSVAEAIQNDWCVDGRGITVEPRIGQDTDIILREGQSTVVDYEIVNDVSKVATMLLSSGADIDGLPLFTITEDKNTRQRVGRTIMRQQDFRNIASYFQLIGLSRTELKKRAYPEKRIRVRHIGNLNLQKGDSFLLWTKKSGLFRVRIERKDISEGNGREYDLECVTWPRIV